MNLGELRAIIDKMPDQIEVVVPGEDHSYSKATCLITTGLRDKKGHWTEDYGDITPESTYGKRLPIILIGV